MRAPLHATTLANAALALALVGATASPLLAAPARPAAASAARPEPPDDDDAIRAARESWWHQQRAFPAAELPRGAHERAYAAWRALERGDASDGAALPPPGPGQPPPAPPQAKWRAVGPAPMDVSSLPYANGWGPVAGRITALAVDPTTPKTVYAGFGQGGVWKTTDAGATWRALTDDQPSLSIGALAVDPSQPSTLYAGTGEATLHANGWYGAGLLKSTDGGKSWTRPAGELFAGASISKVWVDPKTRAVYLSTTYGAQGAGDYCTSIYTRTAKDFGLYKSTDGGATFAKLADGRLGDFAVDASVTPHRIYFAHTYIGAFRLVEGGAPEPLAGLPDNKSSPSVGSIALALAPSDPKVLYVGVGLRIQTASYGSATVYRSTDAGASFVKLVTAPNYCREQCEYDNVLAVDPTDAGVVYLGGSLCSVWKTTNGLADAPTFAAVSMPGGSCKSDGSSWVNGRVHPDMHAIVVGGDHGTVYTGSDGGFAWSSDGGSTWTAANEGVGTHQFYGICLDQSKDGVVAGGTQDNGVALRGAGDGAWSAIQTSDGGPCVIDPTQPGHMLTSIVFGLTYLYDGSNLTFVHGAGGCSGSPACSDRVAFIAPLVGDPTDPSRVYAGTYRVWGSTAGGAPGSWKALSGDLTRGKKGVQCVSNQKADDYLTAIVVAPGSSATIYTGSAGGVVSGTGDGGASWQSLTRAPLPNRWVSDIAVDASDPKQVYVAFSGFNATTPGAPGHVFRSTDGGQTFTARDIPVDMPVNALRAHPKFPAVLYAGTDLGVMASYNGGGTWSVLGEGLPHVAVYSLQIHAAANKLYAGTYGRSAWVIDLPATPPPMDAGIEPPDGAGGTGDGGTFGGGSGGGCGCALGGASPGVGALASLGAMLLGAALLATRRRRR